MSGSRRPRSSYRGAWEARAPICTFLSPGKVHARPRAAGPMMARRAQVRFFGAPPGLLLLLLPLLLGSGCSSV